MLSTYFLNAHLKNNAYRAMHTFYRSILTEIVFCYILKISRFFVRKHFYGETGIKKIWRLHNSFIAMTDLSKGFPSFILLDIRSINATTFIDINMYYYFVIISALHMHNLIVNFESWIRWITETISKMKGDVEMISCRIITFAISQDYYFILKLRFQ